MIMSVAPLVERDRGPSDYFQGSIRRSMSPVSGQAMALFFGHTDLQTWTDSYAVTMFHPTKPIAGLLND